MAQKVQNTKVKKNPNGTEKPDKIDGGMLVNISSTQEKFLWDKAEPISSANQTIWRKDVAGAIIKNSEQGLKSEFGWQFTLIDPEGPNNDVNNVCAMHWKNAEVLRKHNQPWIATVTGSTNAKEMYNYLKESRVPGDQLSKLRKTVLFQSSRVYPKKINTFIRKDPK
ncbi:hypothetical protein [Spiroplasma endosymbiont of Aspidapion aeneum]|uniref:hypothetical protein n=1 Tax=Spiroplasma endosymbiont of Aspidapion aeneum TaxID=3066276 RepID=UPI00313AD5F6